MSLALHSFFNIDRSSRVRWLAEELGITIEESRLNPLKGEHKQDAFRKLSPFGLVPAAVIDDTPMYDSAAIMLSLAEKQNSELVPVVASEERQRFLSLYFYAASNLDASVIQYVSAIRAEKPDEDIAAKRDSLGEQLTTLNQWLEGKTTLLANFTLADILVSQLLGILNRIDALENYPNLKQYVAAMSARPAAAKSEVFTSPFPAN